jgi:hypothetical protein
MTLPHHNRACLCNLFLKVAWIRLRGGSVRLKRPMRLMCGSCILSALRVGRTEVTLVGRVPPKTYLGGYGVFARTAHSEDNPAGWASWQVICIRNGIFWSDDKSDRGAAPIIFDPCTLGEHGAPVRFPPALVTTQAPARLGRFPDKLGIG